MPVQIGAPDGTIAEFPDGTDDATIERVMRETWGGPGTAPPAAPRAETSLWRDIPGSVIAGVGSVAAMPGQLYGLATGDFDTAAIRGPKAIEEFGRGIMSPGLRQKQEEVQAAIKAAEAQGLGAEVLATLKGYLSDPYLLANFAVEQIPSLIGTLGGGKLAQMGVQGAAKLGGRQASEAGLQMAGQRAAISTGAAMQGGQVGQQTYDEIMGLDDKVWVQSPDFNRLIQEGKTPEEAKQEIATTGARMAGGLGAGVSYFTGLAGGAEKAAFGEGLKGSIVRRALGIGAKEGAQEAAEEGLGQLAQNAVVGGVDPSKPLLAGVGSQATLGALGGAPTGAAVGAFHGAAPVAPVEEGGARVEPPPKAPDINEPFGFRTDAGVLPVRVLEYIQQDGETFARIAEETADGARHEAPVVVPLADLMAGIAPAPEVGGRARPEGQGEGPTQEDIQELVRQEQMAEAEAEQEAPAQGALPVDQRQPPKEFRDIDPHGLTRQLTKTAAELERARKNVAYQQAIEQRDFLQASGEQVDEVTLQRIKNYEDQKITPLEERVADLRLALQNKNATIEAQREQDKAAAPGSPQGMLTEQAVNYANAPPVGTPPKRTQLMTMTGKGTPVSAELEGPHPRKVEAPPPAQGRLTAVQTSEQVAEKRAENERRSKPASTRYFDYDKGKSFRRLLDRVLGKKTYEFKKVGGQFRATMKDGAPLTVGQAEQIERALSSFRDSRVKQSKNVTERGGVVGSDKYRSLLETIAGTGVQADSKLGQEMRKAGAKEWKARAGYSGNRLLIDPGEPGYENAFSASDRLAEALGPTFDDRMVGQDVSGDEADRMLSMVLRELAGERVMPIDYYETEQGQKDLLARKESRWGTEEENVPDEALEPTIADGQVQQAIDAEEVGVPDYEPPLVSDEEWQQILQEAEDARSRDTGGETREGVAEPAEDEGRGVERERQPGEEDESAGAGEEAGAAGEAVPPGGTFESVANVEGATEQGVLKGGEQKPEESDAARKAAEDKRKAEEDLLEKQQSKMRGRGTQKPAGGMFGEKGSGDLFQQGTPTAEARVAEMEAVREAVRAVAGPDAKVDFVDQIIDAQGEVHPDALARYDTARKVIEIAVGSPDYIGAARHEVVHMLRDLGVIPEARWNQLAAMSNKYWRKYYDVDGRYTEKNTKDAYGNPVTPERLAEIRTEEGIAEAYGAWVRGDYKAPTGVRGVFEKVRDFFRDLGARLAGNPVTARQIFQEMDAGKYADFATRALRENMAANLTGMNATTGEVASNGAHAAGERAMQNEARAISLFQRNRDKTGPRWLSWPTRMLSFPLARAATDPMLAAYTNAELGRQKKESAVARAIQDGVSPIFALPVKEQNDIRKALELIALNNAFPPVINGRMTVANNTSKIARLTGPKRIVRLSPEATKAMLSYKEAMDGAWQAYGEAAVKRVTRYDGDMTPAAARARAVQERAAANPKAAKDADMAADILEAVATRKRQGYYPAMRDGDTQVVVRRKLTPEFARLLGMARKKGYGSKEALSSDGIDRFLDAATKPEDIRFWSELKSDFDDERAKHGNLASVNDDMIWNEHFHVKPPFMGEVIPQTERARKARTDAKIAEVRDLMLKRGIDMDTHEIVTRPVRDDLTAMINDQSVPVLEKLVRMATAGDPEQFRQLWDGISDQIGKEMVSGFRRRSDVVPGFSMEIGDTLSRYSHAVGNVAARLEYKLAIDDALDNIKTNHADPGMRGADGYAARLKEYVDDPTQDYNSLKTFGFMYYLWGVPSSAIQNVSQIPFVALPQMAGIMGPRGAGILSNAWAQSMQALRITKNGVQLDVSKLGRTLAERAFMRDADAKGLLTATVSRELTGRDYDAGPELQAAQGFWGRVRNIGASMFDGAESLNRATALLAGYRAAQMPGGQERLKRIYKDNENFKALANRDGTIDPAAFGEFFSREVNFEGARVNRPEALRGLGGVVFQFKSYPMNYVSLLRKNATQMGPEGKVAAILMVGLMMMGGGLMGLPFAEDASDLFDNIGKLADSDPMIEHTLRQAMEDWGLSKLGAEAASRGLSRMTGLDLSGSLGMGRIAPRMDNPIQALGPTPAAFAGGTYYAWQRLKGGQTPAAAAMEVAPRALKGPIQAASVLPEEGLVSRSNRQIIPPSKITAGERAARATGFQPAEFSREYERRGYERDVSADANREATALRSQYQRLLSLSLDKRDAGKDAESDALLERARKVAEAMAEKGIKVPTGRDAVGPNVDPSASALRQAPKRVREKLVNSPYPGRE